MYFRSVPIVCALIATASLSIVRATLPGLDHAGAALQSVHRAAPPTAVPFVRSDQSCGWYALQCLALQARTLPASAAGPPPFAPPPGGFSLSDLQRFAPRLGLHLITIREPNPARWPVPAIVHWREGHFSALVSRQGSRLHFQDHPRLDRFSLDMPGASNLATGFLLAPVTDLASTPVPVADSLAASIRGGQRVYPPVPRDDDDEPCPTDEEASTLPQDPDAPIDPEAVPCPGREPCPPGQDNADCIGGGMPVWRVSEPFVNLWIKDTPLFYTMSNGRILPFTLRYKQRGSPHNTNVFGCGNHWECSWLSYFQTYEDGSLVFRVPGGGRRRYHAAAWGEQRGQRGELASQSVSSSGAVSYSIAYPSLCFNRYATAFRGADSETAAIHLLTQKQDPHGRTLRFLYATNQPFIRLDGVVDYDGRTCTLAYTNRLFPRFITSVRDPYGREARFQYDTNGNLIQIVDALGITNAFRYDTNGFLTHLLTPYGTTRFQTWQIDASDPALPIRRSVLVTLPTGDRQAFAYYQELGTDCVPDFYGDTPRTGEEIPEAINEGPLNRYSSFHWNSSQMNRITNAWPSFNPEHFRLARWRYWDMYFSHDGPALSTRLLFERQPSPDGLQPGQRSWYSYWFDPDSALVTARPSLAATRLPDGTVRFTHWTRNAWGRPTQIEETFSVGNGISLRQTAYAYDTTDRNVLQIWGPAADEWGQPTLRHSFLYNEFNQITHYANALGETTRLAYHPVNRNLLAVTHPFGLAWTNPLASDGFPTRRLWHSAIGPPLATNDFAWTAGKLSRLTDVRGQTTTNFWDPLGRLTGRTFADGSSISNVYTKSDNLPFPGSSGSLQLLDRTRSKDRLDQWSSATFSALRQPLTQTDPLGRVTRFAWCSCGSLESVTDPLGNTTRYEYDLLGRPVAILAPDRNPVRIQYNAIGQPTNLTDGITQVALGFNHQGLWNALTLRDNQTETASFDILDRLEELRSARTGTHRFTYDPIDRLLSHQVLPSGDTESLTYSPNLPWPSAYTNALHTNVIRFDYDPFGRLTQRTAGSIQNNSFVPLATDRFTYDAAGALIRLVDPLNRSTQWQYDRFGRPIRKQNALGQTVWTNTFNPNGWLLAQWTPARTNLTRYAYDAVGNLTNIDFSHSDTADLSFAYDANDRLAAMTDALGTTRFLWDASGAFAAEDGPWPDDTVTVSRQNSPPVHTLSLLQPGIAPWRQTNRYDTSGRLAQLVSPAGAVGFAYQTGSTLVKSISFPNGATISNRFDPLGRLLATTLSASDGAVLNQHAYLYNPAHQRTRHTGPEGNFVDYQHDPLGQLVAATAWDPPATLRPHETVLYQYDAAGNPTRQTRGTSSITSSFDTLNRRIAAARDPSTTVSGWTSPSATNVTVNAVTATLFADHTFARPGVPLLSGDTPLVAVARDSLGRLATNALTASLPSDTTFRYDLNGNLLGDQRRSFAYDDRDQLVAVLVTNSTNPATLTEFVYDALGRRRITRDKSWQNAQWILTAERHYVCAGPLVLQERDAQNAPVATYTRGPDLAGGFATAGGIGGLLALTLHSGLGQNHYFYHADGAGNVTALIDAAQAPAARYLYDPFGSLLAQSGPIASANPYRFSSKELHAPSALYYFGARFYEPDTMRWTTPDRLEELPDVNTYRMVSNSPTTCVDPFGYLLYREYGSWPLLPGPTRYMYGTHWYETAFVCTPHNIIITFDNTCYWAGKAIAATFQGIADTIASIEHTVGVQGLTESLPITGAGIRGLRGLSTLRRVPCPRVPVVYRRGTLPNPQVGWEGNFVKGKCWAPENPLSTPDYAVKYGLPAENSKPEWVVGGRVNGPFIRRPSPPAYNQPDNVGGGTEIFTPDPNVVDLDWFHMPD